MAVAAAGEGYLGVGGLDVYDPHSAIGRVGEGEVLPGFAGVLGPHHRSNSSRGGVANGQEDGFGVGGVNHDRSEEHTSELQSQA